jgi:hypothetical protein
VKWPFAEERGPNEPLAAFDAYFTWSDYYKLGTDFHEIKYFWNGSDTGKGSSGFAGILMRLADMPIGSRVLVYPCYVSRGSSDMVVEYPFDDSLEALGALVRDSGLVLVLSARDHQGNVLPMTRHW